jgi:hypothetical protein
MLNNYLGKPTGPYDGPPLWEFCTVKSRPRVRAAALEGIYYYI